MIAIREVAIRCPTHHVSLVWLPKPIADDVVACPICGAGGPYKQVVERGAGLITDYLPPSKLSELLKQAMLLNE